MSNWADSNIDMDRMMRFVQNSSQADRDELKELTRRPVPLHNVSLMGQDDYIKWEPIPHLLAERQRRILAIVERVEQQSATQPDRFTETDVMRAFGLVDDKGNPQ